MKKKGSHSYATLHHIKDIEYKPLILTPHLTKWLGRVPKDIPFFIAIGGDPFAGKSSFALKLSEYLAYNGNILFLPIEEPIRRGGLTISQKINDLNISPTALKKIYFSDDVKDIDTLDKEIKQFDPDFIIIDSASALTGDNTTKQNDLINYIENSTKAFICILHQKKGTADFKGSNSWKHSPDIFIWINNINGRRIAEFKKNRYLGKQTPLKYDLQTERVLRG